MLLFLILAAAPAAPLPAPISAPLGHFGDVVEPAPKTGAQKSDPFVDPKWEGCSDVIFLQRFATGAGRAIEQLQQALDAVPGSEAKLFTGKATLADVLHQLNGSAIEAKSMCPAPTLLDGWKLPLVVAPKKWCDAKPGEQWFFNGPHPAAVISIVKSTDGCKPRISAVLFDSKGTARVRFHGDWSAAMAVTLVGDRCKNIELTFSGDTQTFTPSWSSCKR